MDNTGRNQFWEILKTLHGRDEEEIKKLISASPWPKYLCRFRSVKESTLQQLNNNQLFFSSANYYDDPFDTYFYIDVQQMIPEYERMYKALIEGNKELLNIINGVARIVGIESDVFTEMLKNNPLDFANLKEKLIDIRSSIQKSLFSICFCEDPYNETLWLKYADNYNGFVLVYDLDNRDNFLCGKDEVCLGCASMNSPPNIYPVYYSDARYDATRYALGVLLLERIQNQVGDRIGQFKKYVMSDLMWEPERISLIKKKCHEYDQEWRMIRPIISEQRSFIKMKPCIVIIGFRTPEYETRLIVSAAVNAGISEIHKLYINESDMLDSKPVSEELFRVL